MFITDKEEKYKFNEYLVEEMESAFLYLSKFL